MMHRFMRYLTLFLLCTLILPLPAAEADVLEQPGAPCFPVKQSDGTWAENAPRPFIEGEMGEGLLEIWFGRVNVYDCFIVRCNGEVMMIDGGTAGNCALTRDFLAKLGVEHLDYMFSTHHHDDHMEAQRMLLNRGFPVDEYLTPYERNHPVEDQEKMEYTVDKRGIPYHTIYNGDTMMLGGENGAKLSFFRWLGNTNANFSSMMCRIDFGGRSVYLMADVCGPAQTDLAKNYLDLIPWNVDIFKVGHHGYTKQDENLLRAASPQMCIITNSVAASKECQQQLDKLDIPWKITQKGTIYLRTDGGDDWLLTQDKTYLQER